MNQSKVLEVKDVEDLSEDDNEQWRVISKISSQHYGSFYLRVGAVGKHSYINKEASLLLIINIIPSFRHRLNDLFRSRICAVFRNRPRK